MKIYISFPEKCISYDCQKCKALCCHHGTLVLTRDQFKVVSELIPHLIFITKYDGKLYYIPMGNRCWFLTENYLCLLQTVGGINFKPLVCQQHPLKLEYGPNNYYIVKLAICPTIRIDFIHGISYEECRKVIAQASKYMKNKQKNVLADRYPVGLDWEKRFRLEEILKQLVVDRKDIETCEDLITFQEYLTRKFLKNENSLKKIKVEDVKAIRNLSGFAHKVSLIKKRIASEVGGL
jgi:Fe-S-cluster containining protein